MEARLVRSPMIELLVFTGLVLIGLVTTGLILLVALSVGPRCPACSGEAVLIRSPLRYLPALEWRWCTECGWEGWLRRRKRPQVEQPVSTLASRRSPD
jgi:hypothetical protein